MEISAAEEGVTRVFHLDLPADAVERFTTQAGTGEWPLQYALGAETLRPAFVEVVRLSDLGDMALSTYLAEAHALSGPDFEAARPQLDALAGHVVVLPSQAFDHTAQVLNVQSPLRWIGTFLEPRVRRAAAPLHSEAARGTSGGSSRDGGRALGGNRLLRALAVLLIVLFVGALAIGLGLGG
ncbi:aspartate carbamoyltransferase catalytic subunit [Roseivivax isoporae]|uniref:Aspartate carbamoyltransferase catalytic subunit n=1 Tax=Roseivivax isoporae LMG 25204 TaxID=1449351 RepID=X7F6C6_9RHOB|nr:aspartate carbamoyltransferase catalytic subunit [Roseivivax isoporae]ETX27599.1 aspartate carbamoyltransferase catalytic subunit [Roseivivax isoporae LMG 25204]